MQRSYQDEPTVIRRFKGDWWIKQPKDENVIFLGIAPKPRNHTEAFIHHICHGLMMRYPLKDVLVWSWQNRDSFD
jgi:hypothetical protein